MKDLKCGFNVKPKNIKNGTIYKPGKELKYYA